MQFVRQVAVDAVRLLAAAPADLIVTVAVIFIAATLVATIPVYGIVGLAVLNFAGGVLLGAGLLGRPAPDGLAGATARLRRRIAAAARQLAVVVLLYLALAVLLAIVAFLVASAVAPGLLQSVGTATAGDQRAQGLAAAMALPMLVALLAIEARLLPSAGLVLDRDVGAVESLRMSWAATRGRTLACLALVLLALTPSLVFSLILPPDIAAFFSVFAIVLSVAVGVAAYRALFADVPHAGLSAAPPTQ